jgi:carboxymethylenebutenolidase
MSGGLKLDVAEVVGYYRGGIVKHLEGDLYSSVMLHFGEDNTSITPGDILRIMATYPQADLDSYPGAGHGFNREAHAGHTKLALNRTLGFLKTNVGGGNDN